MTVILSRPEVRNAVDAETASELAEAPLLLLVNAQTRGSAEVLVGALRAQDRGIVIGGPTAGSAPRLHCGGSVPASRAWCRAPARSTGATSP